MGKEFKITESNEDPWKVPGVVESDEDPFADHEPPSFLTPTPGPLMQGAPDPFEGFIAPSGENISPSGPQPTTEHGVSAPPKEATWLEGVEAWPGQFAATLKSTAGGFIRGIGEGAGRAHMEHAAGQTGDPAFLAPVAEQEYMRKLASSAGISPEEAAERLRVNPISEYGKELFSEGEREKKAATPKNQTFWQQATSSAATSLGLMGITAVPSLVVKSPGPMLAGMGALTAGEAYGKSREKGLSVEDAYGHRMVQGIIETGTELLPAKVLFKAGTAPLKRLVNTIIAEVPSENVATVLQSLDSWARDIDEQMTGKDFLGTIPILIERMKMTSASALISSGVQSGASSGIHAIAEQQDAEQKPKTEEEVLKERDLKAIGDAMDPNVSLEQQKANAGEFDSLREMAAAQDAEEAAQEAAETEAAQVTELDAQEQASVEVENAELAQVAEEQQAIADEQAKADEKEAQAQSSETKKHKSELKDLLETYGHLDETAKGVSPKAQRDMKRLRYLAGENPEIFETLLAERDAKAQKEIMKAQAQAVIDANDQKAAEQLQAELAQIEADRVAGIQQAEDQRLAEHAALEAQAKAFPEDAPTAPPPFPQVDEEPQATGGLTFEEEFAETKPTHYDSTTGEYYIETGTPGEYRPAAGGGIVEDPGGYINPITQAPPSDRPPPREDVEEQLPSAVEASPPLTAAEAPILNEIQARERMISMGVPAGIVPGLRKKAKVDGGFSQDLVDAVAEDYLNKKGSAESEFAERDSITPYISMFEDSYKKVGKGRDFVRIHRIRKDLGLGKHKFNALIKRLANDHIIQLEVGNPSALSNKEVDNSYTDEANNTFVVVSWRGTPVLQKDSNELIKGSKEQAHGSTSAVPEPDAEGQSADAGPPPGDRGVGAPPLGQEMAGAPIADEPPVAAPGESDQRTRAGRPAQSLEGDDQGYLGTEPGDVGGVIFPEREKVHLEAGGRKQYRAEDLEAVTEAAAKEESERSFEQESLFEGEYVQTSHDKVVEDRKKGAVVPSLKSGPATAMFKGDAPRFKEKIGRIIQKMAPQVSAVDITGDKVALKVGGKDVVAGGTYSSFLDLIRISMESDNPVRDTVHEVLHHLRGMGMLTDQEWAILEKKAPAWRKEFETNETYGEFYREKQKDAGRREEQMNEEAIGDAFAEWWTGGRKVAGRIGPLFNRMKNFIERVRNLLGGLGYISVEDVFEQMASGEVGARTKSGVPSVAEMREMAYPVPSLKKRVKGTPEQERAMRDTMDVDDGLNLRQWAREKVALVKSTLLDKSWRAQKLADQFESIKRYEKDIRGGIPLGFRSAYKMVRMTQNIHSQMAAVLRHGPLEYVDGNVQVRKGFKGGLEGIFMGLAEKGTLQLWKSWAMANRAKRLMEEGRENNMSQDQIDELLKLGDQYPEFQKVLDKWTAFNKATLDFAEDAGLINEEQRATWEKDDYVPFYRILEEDAGGMGPSSGKGPANQTSGIRRLIGGKEKVGDILENILLNTTHLVTASTKNIAMLRVMDVLNEGGLANGEVLSRASKKWKSANVPLFWQPKEVKEKLAEVGLDWDAIPKDERNGVIRMMTMVQPKDPDVISFMLDGEAHYYRVNDPALLSSLTLMNKTPAMHWAFKMMQESKRVLTTGVTSFPGFMARNFVRDSLHSWIVSGEKFTPFVGAGKGFVDSFTESEELVGIMASGGGSGGFYRTDPKDVKKLMDAKLIGATGAKILDGPKAAWEWWRKVGQASENANRIAIYKSVLKRTGDPAEAAFQALDIMDFSMHGDSRIIQHAIVAIAC